MNQKKSAGVENDESLLHHSTDSIAEKIALKGHHFLVTQVILADDSDLHNTLCQKQTWLLHPSEKISLKGNLFVVENLENKTGTIFVKEAPLPHARPTTTDIDFLIQFDKKEGGYVLSLYEAKDTSEKKWNMIPYSGDRLKRTAALHHWQQSKRPQIKELLAPQFLCNTWGDRSRDSRINVEFIKEEILAAKKLGADIVQLDDGWQNGTTANSAQAQEKGGVWDGFWNTNPQFWKPNPERLPNGLEPLIEFANQSGIKIGLWYAPDSWQELKNWEMDANQILKLHQTLGVEYFKIDSVVASTSLALKNFKSFIAKIISESNGKILLDFDITAGIRPGHLGAIEAGPLFIENRYTDWRTYWPHQTLSSLWCLSNWIDPRRLRMEFLNHERNIDLYKDDPLAPANYDPETLFATVMFSNPLGWFEASNLSENFVNRVSTLVTIWKTHRTNIFNGTIMPIGSKPTGFSYTGFISASNETTAGYVLIFRELNESNTAEIEVPGVNVSNCKWEILAGSGDLQSSNNHIIIKNMKKLHYTFARYYE